MPSQGVLESMANVVAGSFALAACVISVFSIAAHLRSTRHAQLCNYTIRVLLMVPIYAGEAWAGLVWHSNSTIWAVARSCYEAFVIFSFMQLMLSYLTVHVEHGEGRKLIRLAAELEAEGHEVPHLPPLVWCCKPWEPGPVFLRRTLVGVFQYTAIMPVVGVVTLVAWCTGVYYADDNGDGDAADDGQAAYQWEAAYPYLSFVQLVSQGWAIYCLVMFYHAICGRLAAINPLAKLVAIKGIVFFTWAQEVGIGALQTVGFIHPIGEWDASALSDALNNFVICVEMLIFAIAFVYIFPTSDYENMSVGDPTALRHRGQSNAADPEDDPWNQRQRTTAVRRRDMLLDFVKGINFFDLVDDIVAMQALGRAVDASHGTAVNPLADLAETAGDLGAGETGYVSLGDDKAGTPPPADGGADDWALRPASEAPGIFAPGAEDNDGAAF